MTHFFGRFKTFYDCVHIENLELPVSGHGTATIAVCPSVHHHDAVSGGHQKLCIWEHGGAIVRSTVQEKNPVAVWMDRPGLPAIKNGAIIGADNEVFTGGVKACEKLVGLGRLPHGEAVAKGMQNRRTKDQAR